MAKLSLVGWLASVCATLIVSACGNSPAPSSAAAPPADAAPGDSGPSVSQGSLPVQQAPANAVGGFSIDLGDPAIMPIVMKPGAELFPCIVFPLEVTGTSRIVAGGVLTPSAGLHHGNITTRPTDGIAGIHPCPNTSWTVDAIGEEATDILAGGQVLFASTTQIQVPEWESFPAGMGYEIKDGFQIIAHLHYLNISQVTETPAPKYQWYTVDPSTVTQELYPFVWRLTNFMIPPHTQQTSVGACDFPSGMQIVNILPHMHQLATGLDLAYLGGPDDGQDFLVSPGYSTEESLQRQYQPAVDLSQGSGMTMSCSWDNTTDQTIIEGTGINEMCMIFGYGWPGSATYSAQFSPGDDTKSCGWSVAPGN
jgi:hypothetical protein